MNEEERNEGAGKVEEDEADEKALFKSNLTD